MELLKQKPETAAVEPEITAEIFQRKAETFQKKAEISAEMPSEMASEMEKDISYVESDAKASRLNQALKLRISGKSFKEISEATKISQATLCRILKDVPLGNGLSEEPVKTEDVLPSEAMFASEMVTGTSNFQPPKGFTLSPSLSAAEWSELNSLPKNKLIAIAGELKAKEKLQSQNLVQRHSGNGDSHEENRLSRGEDLFWYQMSEIAKIKKAKLAEEIFSTEKKAEVQSTTSDIRTLLEAVKILAPKSDNPPNPWEVYRMGRQDEQKNLETAVMKAETNSLDIQLEQIRQAERADNRKIDFELEKWRHSNDESNAKWELIEHALSGPIGRAIQDMGNATAQRLVRGRNKMPVPFKIDCPNCQQGVFIDRNSETAICGRCGVALSRGQEQEQPQEAQTIEETPEEESSEQAPEQAQEGMTE